jgi:2-oxoglutarate ferredoxin oxidoreductase subunit alpha
LEREKKGRLIQGNHAAAMAAIDAGVRFFAGYPITPSTEVAEYMAEELPKAGGKFIQMEDEIAGMGAILGAALTGVKTITATSGPGFSLKQENLGFGILAEIPCVVINVQRMGPSTGGPTAPAQGDVMQARWGTHGDHPIIALSPASVLESYELTVKAVNFSEKFRIPVILLLDEVIGHMREKVVLPDLSELEIMERQRPTVKPEEYRPFAASETGIPAMADFGTGYRWHVTGLFHDEMGAPSGKTEVIQRQLTRILNKLEPYKEEITLYKTYKAEDAEYLLISFGCSTRSSAEAVEDLRAMGIKAGLLQLQTIWPFPDEIVRKYSTGKKALAVVELNNGQVLGEVIRSVGREMKIQGINKNNGEIITPAEIAARIKEAALSC